MASYVAGVMSWQDAARVVKVRGEAMQHAIQGQEIGMVAIMPADQQVNIMSVRDACHGKCYVKLPRDHAVLSLVLYGRMIPCYSMPCQVHAFPCYARLVCCRRL